MKNLLHNRGAIIVLVSLFILSVAGGAIAFISLIGNNTGDVTEAPSTNADNYSEPVNVAIQLNSNNVKVTYSGFGSGQHTTMVDINVRWSDGTTTNRHENRYPFEGDGFVLTISNNNLCPTWVQVHGTNEHPEQTCNGTTTPTPTATTQVTSSPTATPLRTASPSPTTQVTATPTSSPPVGGPSSTPTPSPTPTRTATPTPSSTANPTGTPQPTASPTTIAQATSTPTPGPTNPPTEVAQSSNSPTNPPTVVANAEQLPKAGMSDMTMRMILGGVGAGLLSIVAYFTRKRYS